MKVKRFTCKIIEVISCLVILLSVFRTTPAAANSAMTHWSGTDSSGVIVTDEECPIIVEDELLTFDVEVFPQHFYENKEDQLNYSAKVTAQYTFYNPAEYTVTVHLLFPFGSVPQYGGYYNYDADIIVNPEDVDDTSKFDITVDGEAIEKNLRHTLRSGWYTFDLEEDLARLHDEYIKDPFFEPNLPVTKYTYFISGVDEKETAANVAFDVDKFEGKTKIMFLDGSGMKALENGKARLSAWAENNKRLTVYVFGQPLSQEPEWRFFKDGAVEDGAEIRGNITLMASKEMTFEEFALASADDSSRVLKHDWYNAVVAYLNSHSFHNEYGVIDCIDGTDNLFGWLMRWYEYEITIEPGERIVNTVTAPLYPYIDEEWKPAIFDYTYLLSPAQTWAEFGSLEIIVNTPFYMTESNLGEFEKDSNGYRLSLESLPDGDLKFTLCSEENPERKRYVYGENNNVVKYILIIGTVVLICAAAFVVIFIRHKRKQKRMKQNI